MDEPETQVRLEVVEATMSSPMFRAEPDKPAVDAHHLPETSDLPPVAAPRVSLGLDLAVIATFAVAASIFAGDGRVAVVAGSIGFLAVGFRRIDRRVPFSFGEGFLPYRSDLGWPRGVQEDDDFRWNWIARSIQGQDAAGPGGGFGSR